MRETIADFLIDSGTCFRRLQTAVPFALAVCLLATTGCATARSSDTARTATEQLLISNAVDQAIAKIDFTPLAGRAVYLEEKYIDGADRNYLIASLRHAVLASGSRLVTKIEDADLVLEARNGGLGTDRLDRFVGMPKVDVPMVLPIGIPEVRLFSRTTQTGTVKLGLIAYDAKTRELLGDGGVTLAQSNDHKLYLLGTGPYTSGTVHNEVLEATGEDQLPLPVKPLASGLRKLAGGRPRPEPVTPVVFEEREGDSAKKKKMAEKEKPDADAQASEAKPDTK